MTGEVELLVVPYYTDDLDYLAVDVFQLKNGQTELLSALEPMEADGIEYLGGSIKLRKAGVYLARVSLSDGYPYQSGAEYLIGASW